MIRHPIFAKNRVSFHSCFGDFVLESLLCLISGGAERRGIDQLHRLARL